MADRDFPRLMLCDKLYRLRFDPAVMLSAFVAYFLGCPAARSEIELDATGASASMVNIAQSTILDLEIPVPPLVEQREILLTLSRELAALDLLAGEAGEAAAVLHERRNALISAAVTGQIDVRSGQTSVPA